MAVSVTTFVRPILYYSVSRIVGPLGVGSISCLFYNGCEGGGIVFGNAHDHYWSVNHRSNPAIIMSLVYDQDGETGRGGNVCSFSQITFDET